MEEAARSIIEGRQPKRLWIIKIYLSIPEACECVKYIYPPEKRL
jgi:hypothetical protein